jgi:ferredoxin
MIRISVDGDLCIGSGQCTNWAPGVFDLDDDGKSYVVDASAAPEEQIRRAESNCPARAISVVTDSGDTS